MTDERDRTEPDAEVVDEASMTADVPPAQPRGDTWFGHPRGLSTLFFTEMWERFSYYGMRALLVLFMTTPLAVANPGLGYGEGRAGAVYGLYTAMVYLLALPGGWVADKLWGQRKAVFVGGCIIAAGHFSMAGPLVGLPEQAFFFLGLILIVIGTGLLKPNVSSMVGDLYPRPEHHAGESPEEADYAEQWGARRDAGFTIFYMGINVGAILGPFICGTLGEKINWHWGFSAAGFGMVLGLIQYKVGDRHLKKAGLLKTGEGPAILSRRARNFYLSSAVVAGLAALLVYLSVTEAIALTLEQFAQGLGYGIVALTVLYFVYLFVAGGYGTEAKKRLLVIFWLFLLAAVFWSGFEQAGSSMNLFGRDLTDRVFWGWEMPATWLQNVNPFFIVIFAPVFGWLWTALARRHANPSIPVKFALGLLGLAAGFFVISWGAAQATAENPVGVHWLIVTYFLHTCGELCLSPVGLSSITKLAPEDRVSQMMGIWFVAAALGNLFAGLVAGRLETLAPSALFWSVAVTIGGVGVLALIASPFVQRLVGEIE
ncbi:MAG: peptide MFS transporter [Thermoanaerobaculia bacterium]|nr:peptide MFS transporter [Thermoanaerobaculia bacterium]